MHGVFVFAEIGGGDGHLGGDEAFADDVLGGEIRGVLRAPRILRLPQRIALAALLGLGRGPRRIPRGRVDVLRR